MSRKVTHLFRDNFTVKDIDKEGKAFDKVSRLSCTSDIHEVQMMLDINMDIYPVRLNEEFSVLIASTLTPGTDSAAEAGEFNQRMEESPLFKEYEYIMFGRVFRYKLEPPNASVYASFGGLLMRLHGDPSNFKEISLDSNMNIYLLMRRTGMSDY
mmetsp:Transcript_4696/g.7867  ORF Transcript_4696/g.7867 Transcript_4696/m.7867 type:complete len:155 (-) Transcript_4696:12-476(-)